MDDDTLPPEFRPTDRPGIVEQQIPLELPPEPEPPPPAAPQSSTDRPPDPFLRRS